MYVKDFNRDKESEALHSGITKQHRLTPYVSVTPHTGLELKLATRRLSRPFFIMNL